MHRASDFTVVVRSGARARHGTVVVHQQLMLQHATDALSDADTDSAADPLVGLVVSRQVGGSVVRHRVSRRLRAQLADRAHLLPAGSGTVVRALPASASASSARLGRDLDRALASVSGPG